VPSALLGKTAALIALLDVRPGDRVLEIDPVDDTTTQDLVVLADPSGLVVSVSAAEVDGLMLDWFDRLVVWSTAAQLPVRWLERLRPGGLGVLAVPVAPLAAADGAVLVRVDGYGVPEITSARPGGLLGTTPELPPRFVDCSVREPDGSWWWLSAEWLHGRGEYAAELMALLRDQRLLGAGPLTEQEDCLELAGYLLASRPDGMITAALGDGAPVVGCALPGSVAVLTEDRLAVGGTDEAAAGLVDWIEEWRAIGRPGLDAFRPYLVRRQTSWEVRFEL
jgi:protein-L-isoaspartate(D-aspartate) O-methyltransferase